MSKPVRTDRFDAAVAEAPPLADVTAVATKEARVSLRLDGDEIIQLTIRPSAWFIAIVSVNWIVTLGLLGAALALVTQGRWNTGTAIGYQVIIGLIVARLVVATLQWATRTYVLTNRRVMRFHGVHNVNVAECPLARISRVDNYATWYQRPLRIGTIRMTSADAVHRAVIWEHVAQSEDIHDKLVRAIRKAQSRD